jgi:adenine-specific DNA methylase
VYTEDHYLEKYGKEAWAKLPAEWKDFDNQKQRIVRIPNRLSHDVEHEALALLARAEEKIGHLYPKDEEGNKPIAYYWARTATCSNPSCGAEVPLLKQFYLANTSRRKVHLKPIIRGTQIDFEVVEGETNQEGFLKRGAHLECPCCGSVTPVKQLKSQFRAGKSSERLVAVIADRTGSGKTYRLPRSADFPSDIEVDLFRSEISSPMQVGNNRNFNSPGWGIDDYAGMFSDRQLLAMQTLAECVPDNLNNAADGSYEQALVAYLGVFIDRVSATSNCFGRIDVTRESFQTPFARQAIPMIFDYPEINLFSGGSGCAANQLDWILRFCNEESHPFACNIQNAASGDKEQFDLKSLDAVVTDPPYYDAIAYADLSDFFYVWLKRTVGFAFPMVFITPQTPKSGECTALKHHHDGSADAAESHFEDTLANIFKAIEHQTNGVVSIMFAHQSTKAWTTLCNSVLEANLCMNGSWAVDTEMKSRSLAIAGDALTSSVTVACRPVTRTGIAEFRQIKREIGEQVKAKVSGLYAQGFRGADLLTACFGHAVGVFGKYEGVEKSDGSLVQAGELLQLTRELAYAAIVSDFNSDPPTQFYIGWLNLFGLKSVDYDDLRKIAQIGLNVDLKSLEQDGILLDDNGKQKLAGAEERLEESPSTGNQIKAFAIDKCHRMMHRWKLGDRTGVIELIRRFAPIAEHELWRVMNALYEVLPGGSDDHKQAGEILSSLESLLRDAKQSERSRGEQQTMEL